MNLPPKKVLDDLYLDISCRGMKVKMNASGFSKKANVKWEQASAFGHIHTLPP